MLQDQWFNRLMGVRVLLEGLRYASARRRLRSLEKERVPRRYAREFALLARQANDPALGLRVLNRIVFVARGQVSSESLVAEKAEYAACLSKLGANQDALELLKSLDGDKDANVYIYQAFALFTQWRYAESIDILRKYVASRLITSGERLLGRLNLAAALVYERQITEAAPLLDELHEVTRQGDSIRFRVNVLQLMVQAAIHTQQLDRAREVAKAALSFLPKQNSLEGLFLSKWEAIALISDRGWNKEGYRLEWVRKQAGRFHHWETLRDCDRWQALLSKDEQLVKKVHFGTPFLSYRDRLALEWGKHIDDIEYLWTVGKTSGSTLVLENLATGMVQRVLLSLAADFYRPFRVSGLHAAIYAGHFFDPYFSAQKVQQAVCRAQKWLRANLVPIRIASSGDSYQLKATRPLQLKVTINRRQMSAEENSLLKIHQRFGAKPFATRDVVQLLGKSQSNIQRILQWATNEGRAEKIGSARQSRYRLLKTG